MSFMQRVLERMHPHSWLLGIFPAVLVLCAGMVPLQARADIQWHQVGYPWAARHIAACADGSIYAVNYDNTLWYNNQGGVDSGWSYLTTLPRGTTNLACAGSQLYWFDSTRTLYRNDGSGSSPRWTAIGHPWAARQIVIATELDYFLPFPVFYAINDDTSQHTIWTSPSGADGTWTQTGSQPGALLIAAGGDMLESRMFEIVNASNTPGVMLNWGNAGCDAFWVPFGGTGSFNQFPVDLSARSSTMLYQLRSDYTLWEGLVTGDADLHSSIDGQPRSCVGVTKVDVHEYERYDAYYTSNPAEMAQLAQYGYRDQGVKFRCYNGPYPQTVPLHRFAKNGSHFFTTLQSEMNSLLDQGYVDEAITCYVSPNGYPLQPYMGDQEQCPIYRLVNDATGWRKLTVSEYVEMALSTCGGYEDEYQVQLGWAYSKNGICNSGDEGPSAYTCPAPQPQPPPPPPPPEQTHMFCCMNTQTTISSKGTSTADAANNIPKDVVDLCGYFRDDTTCSPPACDGGSYVEKDYCCEATGTGYYGVGCTDQQAEDNANAAAGSCDLTPGYCPLDSD